MASFASTEAAWTNIVLIPIFVIPSNYAQKWGQTKCQLPEYPRSGWKAIDVEEERENKKVSENNGPLLVCPPPQVQHASHLEQNKKFSENNGQLRFHWSHLDQKKKNTPETKVGPGFRGQTLAVKSIKNAGKSASLKRFYKKNDFSLYSFFICQIMRAN